MAVGRGGGSIERNGTSDNAALWQLVKFAVVFTVGFSFFRSLGDAVTVYAIWKQLAVLSVVAFAAFYMLVRLAERRYGFDRQVSFAKLTLALLALAIAMAGLEVISNYMEGHWPAWALICIYSVLVAVLVLSLVIRRRSRQEE